MSWRRLVLTTALSTIAVFLSSRELLGQGLRYGHPLHIYEPLHVPLQYLHFKPLHRFHFGHPYAPQFSYHGPSSLRPFFHFEYPVIRERIIIRDSMRKRHAQRRFPRADFWLLALKEGPIYAATDYWLEDETLHYVRRDGTKSSARLQDVDLAFTKRLNRRLGVPFRLPRP